MIIYKQTPSRNEDIFSEYKDIFGKFDGPFCIELLKKMPFPEDNAPQA